MDVRTDGAWTPALPMGLRGGGTAGAQTVPFPAVVGDAVRLRMEGNTANAWNSVTELRVIAASLPDDTPRAPGEPTDREGANRFETAALAYADAMVARGRDVYGPRRSPLFATMLDRRTMELIAEPEVTVPGAPWTNGLRSLDRAWNAANPDDHFALYDLLYATGEVAHAAAADAALTWYARNTAAPTGLIPWGEHAAWRLDTDAPTRHESSWGDRKHELQTAMTHLWPRLFALAPIEMAAYADAVWEQHVYDEDRGLHAHQARLDGAYADEGWLFARWTGSMVSLWAHAYANAADAGDRARYLSYIEVVAAGHAERRHPVSDAAPQYWRTPTEPGQIGALTGYAPDSDLQGVIEAQRALDLGVLPTDTAARLRDWIRRSDATYHRADHPIERGVIRAFDKKLDTRTLAPLAPVSRDQSLWCQSYGKVEPLIGYGGTAMQRHRQSGDTAYLTMARLVGRAYADQSPSCETSLDGRLPLPLWPEPVARAIMLFLDLHEVTGEPAWLTDAERLGGEAMALFLDDTSPLPRVLAADPTARGERAYDHYEAHTGGAELMFALWRLGRATR